MRLLQVSILWMVAFALFGCVADNEDPYKDYVPEDFNWPTLDPNRYHWDGFIDPFYEGWFYKVSDPESGHSFFFIYGVQNPGNEPGEASGSFVHVLRDDGDSAFMECELSCFSGSRNHCEVTIAESKATGTALSGAVPTEEGAIRWNLALDVKSRWSKTMGTLTNIPYLAVNWHVSGLNAAVTGTIEWKGETYTLDAAPAYSDHNWGSVFPPAWLWMQANGFENDPKAAVALAGGPVAIGPIEPPAFMLVFRSSDGWFEFRSQDLDCTFKLDLDSENGRMVLTATKGSDRVRVIADVDPDDFHAVRVPTYDGMEPGSLQALAGAFAVDRYVKGEKGWELADRQVTGTGVLELGGEYGGYDLP